MKTIPFNVNRAGTRLAALDLAFGIDGMEIQVNWFRAYESTDVPSDRWHAHSDFEMHCISEGSACFSFDDDILTVRKGEMLLIPPKVMHKLWNNAAEFSVRHVLSFSLNYSGEDTEIKALTQMMNFREHRCLAMSAELEALLMNCLNEADRQQVGYKAKVQGYLVCILVELARLLSSSASVDYSVKEKSSLSRTRYKKALLYMEAHVEEKLDVKDVAAKIGLSAKQLQRIFMEECGQTVNQKKSEMRLKRAKMLLKDTSYSISQISQIMGFSCEQSFTRFFKHEEGQSPRDYRNAVLPVDYDMRQREQSGESEI